MIKLLFQIDGEEMRKRGWSDSSRFRWRRYDVTPAVGTGIRGIVVW